MRLRVIRSSSNLNRLWNWAIAFATPYLVNTDPGDAGLQVKVFFIWGSTCLGCVIFTYFCIPETRGLSLEQIDLLYQHSTPMTSVKMRNQLLAHDIHAANHDAIAKITGGEVKNDSTEKV